MPSTANHERTVEQCPQCHTPLTLHPDYVPWCAQCNWNLKQQEDEKPASFLDRLYDRLGRKMSNELFQQVLRQPNLHPTLTASKVVGFIIAGFVHLITLLFFVLGVTCLVFGWPNWLMIGLALLLFLIAWQTRPRIVPMPTNIVPRTTCPALYQLLDDISTTLGGRPIAGIAIEPEFNAAFGLYGLTKKPIVTVGLPLFTILNSQERVAILAHEVAHGVNGDILRSSFVGSAVNTLIVWSDMLNPDQIWQQVSDSLIGVATAVLMVPVALFMRGLSKLLMLCAYGLLSLCFRDSQRAEYLADYLASTVSGTNAQLTSLNKTFLYNRVGLAIQHTALKNRNQNVFGAIRQFVEHIPEHEIERLRRVNLLEQARVDTTHPPTAYRIEFLRQRAVPVPKILLAPDVAAQIDAELQAMEPKLHQELMNAFVSRLYA
jgi:heat shock protein HtpX